MNAIHLDKCPSDEGTFFGERSDFFSVLLTKGHFLLIGLIFLEFMTKGHSMC